MKKTVSVLLIFILLLTGCSTPRKEDESATADVKWDSTQSVIADDSSCFTPENAQDLSLITQDEAMLAHENMLSHFGWDMNFDTVSQFMPENYGGCYINDSNVFCVCLVSPSEEDIEAFKTACGTEEIYIQPVNYSLRELMSAYNAIGTYNDSHDTPVCWSWGVDEMNNCISITVAEDMAEEAEALQKEHPCIQYELDIPTLSPAEHPGEKSREDVLLIADNGTYPINSENLSFTLQNNSPEPISFPHKYLEILIDNVWYTIPYRSDVAFTTELPILNAGGSTTVGESLKIRNFDFVPGTYRFGIGYCYDEDYNGNNANCIAWAVFELQ